jgi:hypothetical protein
VFATPGSNTLTGVQYISNTNDAIGFSNTTASIYTDGGLQVTKNAYFSSSMFIKGNLTVFGTQSVSFISSSQLNIGTNLITVNTDTPSIRFGGLAVYDSGSTGLTGSILWDSQDNQWIYTNPSGSEYDSAIFLVGPRNSGTLGNEVGITTNALAKGNGAHHMTSSGIFEVSGSVGIGTVTPLSLLDVNLLASGARRLLINYDDSLVTIKSANNSATAETLRIWGDNIYFYTGSAGSELMRLTNTGRVGIGTTNPSARLHIANSAGGVVTYIQSTATNGEAQIDLEGRNSSGTVRGVTFKYDNSDIIRIGTSSNISMRFETNDFERMRILNGGDVLIGRTGSLATQSSTSKFVVAGAVNVGSGVSNTSFAAKDDGGLGVYVGSGANAFQVWDDNQFSYPRFIVQRAGNVGIGTTSPNNNLHIHGSGAGLNLSGGNNRIYFNNTRAIEGDGTQLQIGEGHAKTFFQTSTGGTVIAVTGSSVGIGTVNPSANLDVNGSMRSLSLYGKAYSQTSSTGTTSIIDTAITSDSFGGGAIYAISWGGNPNAAGSSYYFPHFGYIGVNTTYNGNVVKSIGYTSAAAFDGYTTLTLSVVFWNGSSEVSTIGTNDTTSQIRLKISGYNSSYIGVSQAVYITKIH